MPVPVKPFQLPNVSYEEKLTHCLRIIESYRKEVVPLRREVHIHKLQSVRWEDLMRHWREKYEKSQKDLERMQEENDKLRKEKDRLTKEIEKLTITNNRYAIALFDHGNFKHPENADKKKKGGQAGHNDTNREARVDYRNYRKERLFLNECGKCLAPLSRVSSVRQKILLDIVVNPEVVKLLLESERQWCGRCRMEVYARDARSLPFTEYGINTFMVCLILRFKAHASMENIASVIAISHGLTLSKSNIASLLKQAKKYLKTRYEELKKAVREGSVMYADETGWLVAGQKAWMWIMANENTTVYVAAESRGKGIAEDIYGTSQARCMHDGLRSYENAIPADKQCYCWSHILRFAHEETAALKKRSKAVLLKDELVRIYHIKGIHPEWTKEKLEKVLREDLERLLKITSRSQSFQNIQARLRVQKTGLIYSLLYTPDGTNNLSERELRPMVINKKISNGSNTFTGMETSAIVGSVIQTAIRTEKNVIPKITDYLLTGVKEKYHQYKHTPLYDS